MFNNFVSMEKLGIERESAKLSLAFVDNTL